MFFFGYEGARVVMLCRDLQKARTAAEEIHQETGNPVVVHHLDLASLQSIRSTTEILKDTEPNIHILINNAGTHVCTLSLTLQVHAERNSQCLDKELQLALLSLGTALLRLSFRVAINGLTRAKTVSSLWQV